MTTKELLSILPATSKLEVVNPVVKVSIVPESDGITPEVTIHVRAEHFTVEQNRNKEYGNERY